MEERLDSLRYALIFSALDASCSYWQVKIADANRDKTAFTLITASIGSQECGLDCATDSAPLKITVQIALAYFENNIIFLRNGDEHLLPVRAVLWLLHKVGVTLNHMKGKLFAE